MTAQQIAKRLVELGYVKEAHAGQKWKVGMVIYCGGHHQLELHEAKAIIKKLESV